jgi:hypothetical protein
MNLGQIIKRVSIGVQRDDLNDSYKDFVQEAIYEIEKLRDWSWSHTCPVINWPAGQDRIRMPQDFKAFGEIPAAFVIDTAYNPNTKWPVRLEHRSKFYNTGLIAGPYWGSSANNGAVIGTGVCTPRSEFPMWYDYLDGQGTLGMVGAPLKSMQFEVSYYRYQSVLEDDNASNPFTENEPLLVIARAKAIAFSCINDPLGAAFLQETDFLFQKAQARDERIRLAGVRLRMRG